MICANPKCGKEFEAKIHIGRVKYCSKKCKGNHWAALHPEQAHKHQEAARQKRKIDPIIADAFRAKCRMYGIRRRADPRQKLLKQNREKDWYKDQSKYISDSYIKLLLRNKFGIHNPSPELIEEKRLTIKLKRKIHEVQRATISSGDHGRPNVMLS